MITGLFETHIKVADLRRSMDFYRRLPGLEWALTDEKRRVAFFWIGGRGRNMLGLWEASDRIESQHFAFRCDKSSMPDEVMSFLHDNHIPGYNFLQDGTDRPMVFAWMPAVSIYFRDPDQHELEFIAMLEGQPRPELGIVSLEEWERIALL